MIKYDLIIIGGGPGGYSAAISAGKHGLKTLLIEKNKLGGVCLNEGCIPTKTLLYSAKLYDQAKNSEKYGISTEGVSYDHKAVLKRKDKVIRTLGLGIRNQLKEASVDVVVGEGCLSKQGEEVCVYCGEEGYTAKNIILATGSSSAMPPIDGLRDAYESGFVMTNSDILGIEEIPEKLVIIGGGVIGMEMASYFCLVGADVTIIEMQSQIGGTLDKDISEILMKNYQKKGVKFILGAKVTGIKSEGICYEQDGNTFEEKCDRILISVGRIANTSNLGLDEVGIKYSPGGISVNSWCETNIPNIYAIGDVNGKLMLAHTAYREADVCIENILGGNAEVDYTNIPAVIYTNPEVAYCGLTAEMATERGLNIIEENVSMRFSGRYLAENDAGDGICKLVISRNDKKLVGVHMIANYSSEIIFGAGMMIEGGMDLDVLKNIVFPHPSVAEIIREAILEVKL